MGSLGVVGVFAGGEDVGQDDLRPAGARPLGEQAVDDALVDFALFGIHVSPQAVDEASLQATAMPGAPSMGGGMNEIRNQKSEMGRRVPR